MIEEKRLPDKSPLRSNRRGFLRGVAAVTAGGALGVPVPFQGAGLPGGARAQEAASPLPEYVKWKNPDAMLVHSDQTIETRRAYTGSLITPEEQLYIRNNIKAPDESFIADRDAWMLEITGVKTPKALSVAELKTMGLATVAMVLQCSGNGRGYFQEKLKGTDKTIKGTPWGTGAAGCVIWTGVPLKTVIETLGGASAGAKFITGTGGEKIPAGLNPKDVVVERSVPVSNLDTILLAWELNGKPISLAHGGPLRMIVPGYAGVNNIKYIAKLSLTSAESDAKIQKTGYRMHDIGTEGSPDVPSVWAMEVKSWITSPLTDGKAGRVTISGVAFGGMNAVKGVEVSTDGGKNWREATFAGPDLGRFAWRQFALSTELKPGSHTLVSRATDSAGKAQPEESALNGGGYGHNGWLAPAVKISLA
ncbi:MAG TPA: sulfite oxidase [Alphaproteobacteria bacterium]|nr:sulfite oxidase [Alphaproteobacteria bacterium]